MGVFVNRMCTICYQLPLDWCLSMKLTSREYMQTCGDKPLDKPVAPLPFSFIVFAVRIEDCEGWWLSDCRSSVAERKLRTYVGVLGSIPGNCRPFHFPLFSPQNVLATNEMEKLICNDVCIYLWPRIKTTIYMVGVKLCMTDQCPKKGLLVAHGYPLCKMCFNPCHGSLAALGRHQFNPVVLHCMLPSGIVLTLSSHSHFPRQLPLPYVLVVSLTPSLRSFMQLVIL